MNYIEKVLKKGVDIIRNACYYISVRNRKTTCGSRPKPQDTIKKKGIRRRKRG